MSSKVDFTKTVLINRLARTGKKVDFEAKTRGSSNKVRYGAPDEILHRLPEFFKLFYQEALTADFMYCLGLKNV